MIAAALAYLLNAAWQAPVVALGAWLLNHTTRLTPGWRCRLGVGLLTLAVILPALQRGPALGAWKAVAPAVAGVTGSGPSGFVRSGWSTLAGGASFGVPAGLAALLIAGATGAVGLAAVRLFLGLAAARTMVARSTPFPLPPTIAASLAAFTALEGASLEVRLSEAVNGPVVIGVTRPVILTPPGFAELGEDKIRAALFHECAHVVRGDYAMNLLCEVLSLPLSWHPAAQALKSGVRSARELACDALASVQMGSRSAYARCLVALAQEMSAAPQPAASAGLALTGRGDLEMRVRALIRPGAGAPRPRDLIITLLVLGTVAAAVAGLHLSPRLDPLVSDRSASAMQDHRDPPPPPVSSSVRAGRRSDRLVAARLARLAPPVRPHVDSGRRWRSLHRGEEPTPLAAAPFVSEGATASLAWSRDAAPEGPVQLARTGPAVDGGGATAQRGAADLMRATVWIRATSGCPAAGRLVLVRLVLPPPAPAPLASPAAAPAALGSASLPALLVATLDHRPADVAPAALEDSPGPQAPAAPSPCRDAASAAPAPRPT